MTLTLTPHAIAVNRIPLDFATQRSNRVAPTPVDGWDKMQEAKRAKKKQRATEDSNL